MIRSIPRTVPLETVKAVPYEGRARTRVEVIVPEKSYGATRNAYGLANRCELMTETISGCCEVLFSSK